MSNNAPDYKDNLAFDPDINTMPRCDIEELKSEIKHLKDLQANQDKEVERLRGLLKECKQHMYFQKEIDNETIALLTRINAVIGESGEEKKGNN